MASSKAARPVVDLTNGPRAICSAAEPNNREATTPNVEIQVAWLLGRFPVSEPYAVVVAHLFFAGRSA